MKKEDVELIILKVTADGEDAINMKIYKNGTTCRYGVGGLPRLGIGMMTFLDDSRIFDPLLDKVPQETLDKPLNYEDPETPNGYLEYVIAFYGETRNGDTGERADWAQSTGIRAKIDQQSSFEHPILGLLDQLTMDAAELTNELYFDVVMKSKYKVLSSTLPKQTIITVPKTEDEIHEDYVNYVQQMMGSMRRWSMIPFVQNKTYEIDGATAVGKVTQEEEGFNVTFTIVKEAENQNEMTTPPEAKKKPWWKR
jgi:hypothetical protein